MSATPRLILASGSPRRRSLLTEAGYAFEVIEPDPGAESGEVPGETPAELVARLARQKGANVAQRIRKGLVVACDTVAECDGQVLGKPRDRAHARQMLETLRGREHRVWSGLVLWPVPGEPAIRVAETVLRMALLSDEAIQEYLDSGLWQGKAGGFGLQDRLGWIATVEGSESNVVGLPMELLAEMLAELPANW